MKLIFIIMNGKIPYVLKISDKGIFIERTEEPKAVCQLRPLNFKTGNFVSKEIETEVGPMTLELIDAEPEMKDSKKKHHLKVIRSWFVKRIYKIDLKLLEQVYFKP
ncbi:hypothetical protein [Persicobacter diffluens]|uniref:Uncharacterized protein n=1 Tax=Persicobacter diffluens TaxID=981 RepID=A0AAN5APS0_9BACT|nr:hypothetical protein PEDI_51530 [Persicobacter diffluens]